MTRLDDVVTVDRTSPVPLFLQVTEQLGRAIESGELPSGTQLDSEIQLARQLTLSRPTVRRAIQHLVDEGLVVRERGVGIRVAHPKVRRPTELTGLYDDLASSGKNPTTKVLSNTVEAATSTVARKLALPEGTPVVNLDRLRFACGEPIARLRNVLPATLRDLTTETLEHCGLYQTLRANGIRIHAARQTIGARPVDGADAQLLGESAGATLLTMQRTSYDGRGRVVEYGTHVYRASRYQFDLSLLAR